MKKFGLWLGMFLASMAHLLAQVTVEVTLDQEQFLPAERLPAIVRITNLSGQTLHLGGDRRWLVFSVESGDGSVVLKTGDPPVAGEFTLESSKRAITRVDLAPWFNLKRSGRYSIIATVTISEWGKQVTSAPKSFDIVHGAKLWQQRFGLPLAAGVTNQPPEVRTYTLQQANYLKQLMLYFQLTDASGRINKVFPLGPMISFGQPEAQVDRSSNLHVLYQNGPRAFSYSIINPDGEVVARQTYEYTTRPRLRFDRDGNLSVTGGMRQPKSDDLPPPEAAGGDGAKVSAP